jgi:chromate transport protein ChrA
MDSVLKMEHALTVQLHQTIVNHVLQYNVLIVIQAFLEMINKTFARDAIKKSNIAVIALVLIPAMNVTNQLLIWIHMELVQTVILEMDGKKTLKQDSVNVQILSISKVAIFVKHVIN